MPFIRRRLLAGLAFALLSILARPALATTYFAAPGTGAWDDNNTWRMGSPSGPTPGAGIYPGSAAGDTAMLTIAGQIVTVGTIIPNAVTLAESNTSIFVKVNTGGVLPVTGATVSNGAVLDLNGGTISNAGTIDIQINSGFALSSGTLTGSGQTNIAADVSLPGLLSIAGGTLDAHTINVNGKAKLTGLWSINNGGVVNVAAGGVFDIASIGPISSSGGGAINNSGKVEKTAGAGGTNIVPPLNNNNLVKVAVGALVMNGTHTNGTFDIASSSQLELAGTIAAGTSTSQGLGELKIVSSLTVDSGAIFNITNLRMSGGTLNGPGTANVSGTTTFDGGSWSNVRVNLATGSTTNITAVASATILDNARVDNNGTFNINAGTGMLSISNGGYLKNLTTVNLIGDVIILSDLVNARIWNVSGATILKTAGAGYTTLNVVLDNDGLFQSNSGSMRFNIGGVHTGTFKICDACTLDFAGGTHTLDGALIQYINFNGGAIAKLSGATLDIPTSAQINTNNVFHHTHGDITGDGTLSIFAAYLWHGGGQYGTGETQLASYTHSLAAKTDGISIHRNIVVNGTLTIHGPTPALCDPVCAPVISEPLINSAVLTNAGGTINLAGDFTILSDGTGVISNESGTVNKSSGAGKTVIQAVFNSFNPILVDSRVRTNGLIPFGATLNVTSGQLALNGGGFNSGNIFVPNATNAVVFESNTYNLNAGTSTNPADLGLFRVDGGTLNLGAALTLTNVELLAGTISGSDLTIANKMKWTGGTLLGPGNTTIATPATLTHLAPALPTFLNNRTLQNNGIVEYEGTGLQLANNAVISNNLGAEFRARDGALLNGAGANTFNNIGTLKKTGTSSGMRFDMPVQNTGIVSSEVSGQAFIFAGGGTMGPGGTLTTTAGALIDFFSGSFLVNGGSMTGAGQLRVNGGTLKVNSNLFATTTVVVQSGAVQVPSPNTFQMSTLLFRGGSLQDAGTTRPFAGSIGNISPTALSGDHTLTIPSTFSYDADFANYLTINDTSNLNVESGSTLSITAGNSTLAGFATALLSNSGTVQKIVALGATLIDVPVTSAGTIGATVGILRLNGGGTITGTINTGPAATFELATGSFFLNPGVSITGAGVLRVISGSVDVSPALTIPSLELTGGVLTGAGALTLQNTLWTGGSLDGSGSATVTNLMTISTAGPKSLGRALTNNASVDILSGDLGGFGSIANIGTFTRSTNNTVSVLFPAFMNAGTVNLLTGSVSFTIGGYTQVDGTTNLAGGSISSTNTINFYGGLLKGSGTINADVANNGPTTIAPGASPGIITINGNFGQAPNGVLNLELGGTTAGSQYDRLAVSGMATLGGTVNVTLIPPFVLSNGNVFDVVTYAAHSGAFSPENLPPFPGGTFSSTYTPTAYELVVSNPTPAEVGITKSGPANASEGDFINYTIVVKNLGGGSATGVIVSDPTPSGLVFQQNTGDCTTPFPCSLGTLAAGDMRTIVATYHIGPAGGSSITNTATINVTDANAANNMASVTTSIACPNVAATNLKPSGSGPLSGTLTWSDTKAEAYQVYFGPKGSGCTTLFGNTTTNSMPYSGLLAGTDYEFKVVSLYGSCPAQSSACVTFRADDDEEACPLPEAPLASVVGQATSTKTYTVSWEAVLGAIRYEVEEATSPAFTDAVVTVVNNGLSVDYHHETAENKGYWYRVRAFTACSDEPGPYSIVIRVVIVPPPSGTDKNPNITIPVGSSDLIVQRIFIPGTPGLTQFFTATADRPWLFVTPSSGVLPPSGATLDVVIDPSELPNGTFIATILVNIEAVTSAVRTHGTTAVIPISVNLVTPVTPVSSKGATSQYAVIIPAVGHLGGINSEWQSDVRITNAGFRPYKYRLTFTPAAGIVAGVKQTDVNVDAGATIALDDIVRNWYGFGSLKDGESGMLEILPVDDPVNASLVTVASSRTYNVTQTGTLGQFVPAIPFPSFIGKAIAGSAGQILSLQQLAQSNAFRTNVGITDGSGRGASTLISVFNAAGVKLADIPQLVAAGQQLQLNALLLQKGITLDDGRIEIRVTDGDGKITGYASVVDNGTGDPLLVSGVPLGQAGATRFVLPGAANISTGFAEWRTDMRIFNYGTIPQPATLTFYPLGGGTPRVAQVEAKVGEVLALNNVVKTLFGGENLGGVVHVTTPQPASFIVSGRTYNQTAAGTFGQFISAVTVDQGIARGGKTLHLLQIEDSSRFRTNVAVAEMTGKPATVEMQVFLPDSKITPTVTIPLAGNEFRQFNIVRDLGLGNVYNARVAVRVIDGDGRVTAAGSLIDELTGDPTLIPGQQ